MADSTPLSNPAVPRARRDARATAAGFGDVLAEAQQGGERAWAELYGLVAGQVRAYVAMRGAADPDDLVGETFVQLARNICRFDGGEAEFRSWVFMVAHNRVIDERRRIVRRPTTSVEDHDDLPALGGDVEAEALDALGLERVHHLVERLTPDQRAVLLLRFVADLTLEEIAAVLGRPLGAVKQLQRRALRSLRRDLVSADVPR